MAWIQISTGLGYEGFRRLINVDIEMRPMMAHDRRQRSRQDVIHGRIVPAVGVGEGAR